LNKTRLNKFTYFAEFGKGKPQKLKLVVLVILTLLTGVLSQTERPVKRPAPVMDKSVQERKAAERQEAYAASAEKRGDLRTSYNIYSSLISRYDNDERIIRGYIDISIKFNQIKDCETKIKQIAQKYPAGSDYLDPAKKDDRFKVVIQGSVAEVYLRTGRDQQAYQVFDIIDRMNTTGILRSEIKAEVFLRSGSYQKAEKLYADLSQQLKNDKAYSKELYQIYAMQGKAARFTNELLKMISIKGEGKGSESGDDQFDPVSELFNLYEKDEYKDSILITVEKSRSERMNAVILSELYFNSGLYSKSYDVLRTIDQGRDSDYLAADFGIRLYNEKKYSEASDFFAVVFKRPDFRSDRDFMDIYITSLEMSGRYKEAENVLIQSGVKNRELHLARLYHKNLGKSDEAKDLYEKNLTERKDHSVFWNDYIRLLISKGEYETAAKAVKKVFDKGIMDILRNEQFYEFKYLEALISLFSNDTAVFFEKAEIMIRDDFPSDLDNDLIEIVMDVKTADGDQNIIGPYLKVLSQKIDPAYTETVEPIGYEDQNDPVKMPLIHRLNLSILINSGKTLETIEYVKKIISENMMDNRLAKMFIGFSRERLEEKIINDTLFELIKTGIDGSVKTEIRELIREKAKV
jgi:hypothetical protein